MKMKNIYFFLFLIGFLFGCCSKEDPGAAFESKSIIELTSGLSGQVKDLTQIRLSFAKAVALAMSDIEFRDYIKKISTENNDSSFSEIVFALHKNDKIRNKTLELAINEAADNEIKALYGNNFISKVLEIDPLVCIKIPDIFREVNWQTEKYAPMVLAKTPVKFLDSTAIFQYINYHYSGYQQFLKFGSKPEYLTIVVKYSEDYILLDELTYRNEKGLPIFDIITQTEKNWDLVKNRIFENGQSYPPDPDFKYLLKRDIYEIVKELTEPKSYNFINVASCQKPCKRDCQPNGSYNNVLEKIKFNPLLIDGEFYTHSILEDNINLLFVLADFDNFYNPLSIIDKFSVSGFRKIEFVDRNFEITISQEKDNFEKIGEVILPKINIVADKTKYKAFEVPVNHQLFDSWSGNEHFHTLCMYRITHEDFLYRFIELDNKPLPFPLFVSSLNSIGKGPFNYCDLPNTNYYFGNVDFYVKY